MFSSAPADSKWPSNDCSFGRDARVTRTPRSSRSVSGPSGFSCHRPNRYDAFASFSTVVALAYIFIAGPLLGPAALALIPNVGGVAVGVAAGVVFFLGLFGVLVWWDRWSLPLLAEAPRRIVPLELIDTQSYRTFQEIRARAEGTEVRVAIPGSRSRLGEAMSFAGMSTTSS